jgi:hypothetical protein
MRALIGVLCILVTGCCTSFEDLKAGDTMALENQANLEKNVVRQLDNFEKVCKAQPSWTPDDQKIFDEQKKAILEQLAINYCWLLVIKDAAESDTLDPAFFGEIVKDLPAWVSEGKQVYDLIKARRK